MSEFKIGDKVKVSEYYLTHYPLWQVADQVGTVVKVEERTFPAAQLSATDAALYQARYGKQAKFPLITLFAKFNNQEYMFSQFGLDQA